LRRSSLVVVAGLAAAVREVERDAAMGQAPELEWEPAMEPGAGSTGMVPGPEPMPITAGSSQMDLTK
jgi:hypothetical protein